MRILVTVDKFQKAAKDLLSSYSKNHTIYYNQKNRKLSIEELKDLLQEIDPDIIIAGTETYNKEVLDYCPNLKVISRVGIGLDSLDLQEFKSRDIIVLNTPDAPSMGVAELTIGQMFNCARRLQLTDQQIKKGNWIRYVGKDIFDCTIGIIGYGRIGSIVADKVRGLSKKLLIYDKDLSKTNNLIGEKSEIFDILTKSDIVTIHVPLNEDTINLISLNELSVMKKDAILINTSRGGIINEKDLYSYLKENTSFVASLDVFTQEPYLGNLRELENCYLTPHLGSCTIKSRYDMEIGSVENIKSFIL